MPCCNSLVFCKAFLFFHTISLKFFWMFLIVDVISLSVVSDDLVILLIVVTSAKSMNSLSHLERQFSVKAVVSVL